MKVRQHIPGFVSGVKPMESEVHSAQELETLPFIKPWKSDPDFYRFSVCHDEELHAFMAEFNEGKHWWVLAHLHCSDADSFLNAYPAWKP